MKNIAVFVSGGGTNLGALIKAQNEGIIKSGRITLVVSSSEKAYALKRAAPVFFGAAVCSGLKTEKSRTSFIISSFARC